MKKLIKYSLISVGVVVVVAIAAAITATIIIDPNDYKKDIINVVKKKTGRDLDLKGDINLSLFPWLGLELGQTRFSNAPGFGRKPMASIDKVEVKLKLLPLLRKEIEVDTIVLDGLELTLAKNKQGVSNWDDLVKRTQADKPGAKKAQPKPGVRTAPIAALTIGGIDVRRAQVHWLDATNGSDIHIRNLNLKTSKLAVGEAMHLKLGFDLETGKPVIRTPVTLQGEISIDPDKETLNVKQLQLSLLDLNIVADLAGKNIIKAPYLSGQLTLKPANLRDVLNQLGMPVDMQADALKIVAFKSRFQYSSNSKTASVDDLVLQLDDSTLTGKASYGLGKTPVIRTTISVDQIDVDRYLPTKAKTKNAGKAKRVPLVIPVKLLRTLDLKGDFRLGSLKAMGIRSTKISIPISAKNGLVVIGPSRALLYGGSYRGKQVLDVRKGAPRIQSDEKLTNVQVGGLLKDSGIFDKFTGVGNVSGNVTARGIDLDDILNTLTGTASASLKNGSLSGINIYETINNQCRALKQPGTAPVRRESKNKSTPFADLKASASIVNGVVANQDLLIKGKLLKVSGKGKVNLPKKHIDYLANVNLLGKTTCWTTQFAIPVKGKFSELSAKKIIKETLSYKFKKQIERKAKKAIEEELKKHLGIPKTTPAPTTPEKSPEEKLKEELRKRLGL